MNKNRLIWIFALFLTSIVSLPIAYAQAAAASWTFVLINAAIVGIVLFGLQAFLIPQKADKEKTAVYVAIIGGALLAGFLFGSQGFIWQHPVAGKFLSIYVIANALIIAAILYFIFGLLKINEKVGASKEGLGGYGILLFLVSLIFAVKIGNSWIWELSTARQFISYLIGPEGILNPDPPAYRLWIFITSFVMFAFFLNNFLIKNAAGGSTSGAVLNYALAFIISSNMASAGYGFASIIQLGEIIFLLVLWNGIKESALKDDGGMAFLIALFIVGWASAAVTMTSPDYRGVLGYGFCQTGVIDCTDAQKAAAVHAGGFLDKLWKNLWIWLLLLVLIVIFAAKSIKQFLEAIGIVKKNTSAAGLVGVGLLIIIVIMFLMFGFKSMGKIGLFLLIPLGIIALLLFGILRAGKRGTNEWKKLKRFGVGPLMRKLRSSPLAPLRWIAGIWKTGKDPYIEGQLPPVFKDLRFELLTLMNYQTRLHTYFGKKNGVVEIKNQALGAEMHFASAQKTYDGMRRSLDTYRFGKGGVTEGREFFGWSNNDAIIDEIFRALKDALSVTRTISYQTGVLAVEAPLRNRMDSILEKMNTFYEQYLSNVKRFGLIHRLKSLRIGLVDLLALYGVYKHYYRFANENAIFELWRVKIDDNKKRDDRGNVEKDEKENIIKTNEDVTWSATPIKRIEKYEKIVEAEIIKAKNSFQQDVVNKLKTELKYNERVNSASAEDKRKLDLEIDDRIEEELENEASWNKIIGLIPKKYKLGPIKNLEGVGPIRHEVDLKGFVLADFHAIEVDKRKLKYVRRVKLRDIEEFPSEAPELAKHSWIATQVEQEWEFLLQDLRWGNFHPYSRSDVDYTEIMSKQWIYEFSKVGKTPPSKDQQKAAFDLEALKIPHLWVYWGRRNYWDKTVYSRNPYPTLSTVGLSRFITALVRLRNSESIANKYLATYVWDTGRDDQPFTTVIGKEVTQQSGR